MILARIIIVIYILGGGGGWGGEFKRILWTDQVLSTHDLYTCNLEFFIRCRGQNEVDTNKSTKIRRDVQ